MDQPKYIDTEQHWFPSTSIGQSIINHHPHGFLTFSIYYLLKDYSFSWFKSYIRARMRHWRIWISISSAFSLLFHLSGSYTRGLILYPNHQAHIQTYMEGVVYPKNWCIYIILWYSVLTNSSQCWMTLNWTCTFALSGWTWIRITFGNRVAIHLKQKPQAPKFLLERPLAIPLKYSPMKASRYTI